MVTFAVGTVPEGPGSEMTLDISINDDNCVEESETFTVSATTLDSNARFPATSTMVTIESDDGQSVYYAYEYIIMCISIIMCTWQIELLCFHMPAVMSTLYGYDFE